MTIHAMFLNRDFEHLRCGGTVDVAAFLKDLLTPCLTGKPCQYSGLNSREVRNDELIPWPRHKCRADQLGKSIWDIFIEKLHAVKVATADKSTGLCQIRKMILGQILHLNNASGPATGSVGTVELKHSTGTSVGTHCLFHRLILLNR